MILFRISRVDSDDLCLWRRALLPALALRRSGVSTRIVAGALDRADLAGAAAIVFAGAIGQDTGFLCRLARDAGLRVVLDIADTRSLGGDGAAFVSAAGSAHRVFAADAALAAIAKRQLGVASVPVDTLPDLTAGQVGPLAVLAAFPMIGAKVLADAVKIRSIDAVRRLRRWILERILGRRRSSRTGPRVVWFGDGVDLNDAGGLGELLLAAGTLVDLAQTTPFQLRVVGTSRRLFRRTVGRFPLPTDFRRLTLATLNRDLKGAALCFLPAGGDALGRAQSAARAEIVRALGMPVVTAASDWQDELQALLTQHRPATARAAEAARQDAAVMLAAWKAALTTNEEHPSSAGEAPASPAAGRLRVTFLLQQFQDLDLICPVAEAASATPDMEVSVAVLTKVAVPASRRLQLLRERGARISFWHGRDVAARRIDLPPGAVDVAVTASDGGAPGARYASAFVRVANAAGAVTLNLQHGLDNSGLTYGIPHGRETAQFSSRFVLTWGGFERLTVAANAETRAKVIPVGCPKRRLSRAETPDFPVNGRPVIAVFENLHWRRYDDSYRRRFVHDLIETARAAPDLVFLLKPHMGGRWFSRAQVGQPLPDNLILADPAAPQWRRFTADAFLAHATAAITTPSTIALDAARYDLPTALVAYGIEADNYAPLRRIEQAEDWKQFVQEVRAGKADIGRARAFKDAATLAGEPADAIARIIAVIRLAGAKQPHAAMLAELGVPIPPAQIPLSIPG